MGQVLIRARALAGHRGVQVLLVVWLLTGLAVQALPLLSLPGYELGAVLALLAGLTGPLLGVAAARREPPSPWPLPPAVVAAWLLALITLAIPLGFSVLRTWLTSPCDPFATSAFVPLLVIPSALTGVSVGAWAVRQTRARWKMTLLWLGVVALSAGSTVTPILTGPQVFAYNHFAGYLPGPLYDERLILPAGLWWFRLGSLALAFALAVASGAHPRRRAVAAGLLTAFLVIEAGGEPLGFRTSNRVLARELSIREARELVVVHLSPSMGAEERRAAVDDARFRAAQIARFLGAAPPRPVTVWWYPSEDVKQRLVGAGNTQFAKPWLGEVHIDHRGVPHPVLRHELVHAMAAQWGDPLFGVPGRWWNPVVNIGLVEGLAVAADDPDSRLHTWAAAMRRDGLLPPVAELMTPVGFYRAPPRRAYTVAGSFVRYLAEHEGADRLRALYGSGDFAAVYGRPLEQLEAEYGRFLDTVAVPPGDANQARSMFREGAIFDRPCAREVALLEAEAASADPARRLQLRRRCRLLQPDEPSHLRAVARALEETGQVAEARKTYDALLASLEDSPSEWAEVALDRVALAAPDERPLVQTLLGRMVEVQPGPDLTRTARVRLAILDQEPAVRDALMRYFTDGPGRLYHLARLEGSSWVADYLLARALLSAGQSAEALPALDRVLRDGKAPALVILESRRLQVEALYRTRRCDTLASLDPAEGLSLADWTERCRFVTTGALR